MPTDDTLDEDPGNAGDVANDNHDQEHGQVKNPSESGSNENELHEEENLSNGLHCGSSLSQIDEQVENRSDDLPFVENGVEEE